MQAGVHPLQPPQLFLLGRQTALPQEHVPQCGARAVRRLLRPRPQDAGPDPELAADLHQAHPHLAALVREAVATYLTARPLRPEVRPMLAAEFARAWETAPHLTAAEAAALESDVRDARAAIPALDDPWA